MKVQKDVEKNETTGPEDRQVGVGLKSNPRDSSPEIVGVDRRILWAPPYLWMAPDVSTAAGENPAECFRDQ